MLGMKEDIITVITTLHTIITAGNLEEEGAQEALC